MELEGSDRIDGKGTAKAEKASAAPWAIRQPEVDGEGAPADRRASADLDHAFTACVQPIDQGLAPLQRGALVDVALVGDLVAVDRGRLGHEQRALDPQGRTLALGVQARQPLLESAD